MVFRGTRVRCTESIGKSWTKSTALVGTFSTSLEELMHAVLAERASLIWESLWCLCLSLIRGLRERQIICQKCPIDLFRKSLSLTSYSLPGGMEETVSSCSKWTFTASRSSSKQQLRRAYLLSEGSSLSGQRLRRRQLACWNCHIPHVSWEHLAIAKHPQKGTSRGFPCHPGKNEWSTPEEGIRGSFLLSNLAKVGVAISSAAECVRWEFTTEMEED